MELAVSLLATFVLLVASSLLLTTVGRRRRQRHRELEQRAARAIEAVVGSELAQLVSEAIGLRRLLEDAAASGREMLTIETQLGGPVRRPLWRQIEDANFGHELERVRREVSGWLARFDALDAADRQVIELLSLDVAPVRALVETAGFGWEDDASPTPTPRDRGDELRAVVSRSTAAIDCLRRFERELIAYRPGGYR